MYLEQEHYNAYLCDTLSEWFFHLINQPISILDFGCGDGLLTNFMHRAFFNARIIGIDNNATTVQENQKRYPSISFVTNSNSILPFKDSSFDLIYTINVLHHIQPHDLKQTVNELLRVLKPASTLIIVEFNPYNWKR
jgi:ubiquinone/menaquinone biosynthesis C-methylase UbiE